MEESRERFTAIDAARVQAVARVALNLPDATLGQWEAIPLVNGASAANSARSTLLLRGSASTGHRECLWRVVLKRYAPIEGRDDPTDGDYWKREWSLYGTDILNALPAGMSAPQRYARDEMDDGTAWLWQEWVEEEGPRRWTVERWALAARHLGRMNGASLVAGKPPEAPWLRGERLRSWLERHHPQVARIAAAPQNPAVRHWWPQPIVVAILQLWEERAVFCDALVRLPQGFGHGDAIRRNLLSRRGADGSEETVAIDWERAGLYAAGEEVGQTLSVAAAFGDLEPDALPELATALFASYLAGLRDAGWQGDERRVRFAYAAHAALRNAFNAVGATEANEAGRSSALRHFGVSFEELASRRATIRPFLLERAAEARRLLDTL